jgi:hypothetical protein
MIKEISNDKLSNLIIDFESGDISMKDTMYLFQELVDTGLLWEMTENYRKLASKLAEQGLIDIR